MARTRGSSLNLAKLLSAAERPIYALDDERRIVFVNEACASWTGVPAEELVGRQCAFHTPPEADPATVIAAALCPPPELLAGQGGRAIIACDLPGHARLCRGAQFHTMAESVGGAAVLVIVDLVDANPVDSAARADENSRLHDEVRRFQQGFAREYRTHRVIGGSPAIARVRDQIELAAAASANVLLLGPAGSGKQHVARVIHYAQHADSGASLLPLDAALLPPELLISTFAEIVRKPSSDLQGTLLVRNVDQLPAEAQFELNRLLSLGSPRTRIISTSRCDLQSLVKSARFRGDLANRLSTLLIELPPLAERIEDLPLLAQAFLEADNAGSGKQVGGLSPEALDLLAAHAWPGNLDELAAVIVESHGRSAGPIVTPRDLPARMHLAADERQRPRPAAETIDLERFLAEVEAELIGRALKRVKGNKAKAARLLGLTRPKLYRRLEQLGLDQSPTPEDFVPEPPD